MNRLGTTDLPSMAMNLTLHELNELMVLWGEDLVESEAMNIFVLDEDPYVAAKYLDDKRVVKMCLETAQILSTALRIDYGIDDKALYKPTHENHPVVRWLTANDSMNLSWTYHYFNALLNEYSKRFNKVHSAEQIRNFIWRGVNGHDDWVWPNINLAYIKSDYVNIRFCNCARNKELNLDFTDEPDVILAYRKYLKQRWLTDKRKPTWYKKEKYEQQE